MASRQVSAEYLKAGEDYLAALQKLGMRPRFLGWGWELASERWQLVLVTSIVDAGGPLALNRLLFKAYNAEATPKEISPFIVRVFSPEIVPGDFYLLGEKNLKYEIQEKNGKWRKPSFDDDHKIVNVEKDFFGLHLEMINAYQNLPHPKSSGYHERRSEWQRFKRNVEKLAA
jgi:hypothetical protein